MFKKLAKAVAFRNVCCNSELDKEMIDIFTYIDEATGGDKNGLESLEKLSFLGEINLMFLCKIKLLKEHILRLHQDKNFREDWYSKYEFFRDTLIDQGIYLGHQITS